MNAFSPEGYPAFIEAVKGRIRAAQVKAALSANRELLRLYWDIGRALVSKQATDGWGAKVIDRVAKDVQHAFPGLAGFSRTNIYRMRAFYMAYAAVTPIVPQAVGQLGEALVSPDQSQGDALPSTVVDLPWGHHVLLVEKLKDSDTRAWYARAALEHGWSRTILALHVDARLHERQGKALTNFSSSLPLPQSDLAQQALKDPYLFDFLTIADDARERELEQGLIDHIQRFLIELGVGFAFVGRQVPFSIGDQDFFVDLLFYHLKLRCFVVIELKAVSFQPEFAGKMNFYLSAVDAEMRHPDDKPSIGLLLCKSKNQLVVEYALRDMQKPIGVAEWETKIVKSLPASLKGSLPTVEELEAELSSPEDQT